MRVSPLQDAVRRCTPLQGLALTLTGQVVGHAYHNARGHVTCCCLMMPLGCCAAQCPQQLDMLPCPPLQIMETQSEPFLDISEELAHVREARTWVKGPSEHLWAAISACKGDLDTAGGLLARQHCADWVHTALMLLRMGCWHGHIVLLGAHHAHTVVGCLSGSASDTQNWCCQLGPHLWCHMSCNPQGTPEAAVPVKVAGVGQFVPVLSSQWPTCTLRASTPTPLQSCPAVHPVEL